jgi:hypothetical protein
VGNVLNEMNDIMRWKFIQLMLLVSNAALAQISEVEVYDSTFLRTVDMTLDTLKIPQQQLGVVTIEITDLTLDRFTEEVTDNRFGTALKIKQDVSYSLKSSFEMNSRWIEYHPPLFYFRYRSRIILVYMGIEKFIKVPKTTINKLHNKLRNNFPTDGGTYVSPTIWMRVNRKEIIYERKSSS